MFQKLPSSVLAGLGLAAAFFSGSAQAHIRLEDPLPRHLLAGSSDANIKSCPCGVGGSNRICNVMQDGSDNARSTDRVSRFEAGSTITLTFTEYVNHSGRFRVAFDPDGADMTDFNANILADIADPINESGRIWEIPVKLPSMTCSNCTLQLVQAMEVSTEQPISDPAPVSSYYVCVDLELVAPGTLGEDDGMAPAPTDPADVDGEGTGADDGNTMAMNADTPQDRPLPATPGMDAVTGTNSTPSAMATGTETGAGDMLAMNDAPGSMAPAFNANGLTGSGSSNSSAGGCSVGAPGPRAAGSFALLGLLAALALRGRHPCRGRALSAQAS